MRRMRVQENRRLSYHGTRKNVLVNGLWSSPRRLLALICTACVAMLAFGLYLQYGQGLEPCPMCIVQRYALIVVGVFCALAALSRKVSSWRLWGLLAVGVAGLIFFQTIVSVGMNLNLLPVTGLPLPFVSYGGSSLISMMIAVGLAESVVMRHRKIEFLG